MAGTVAGVVELRQVKGHALCLEFFLQWTATTSCRYNPHAAHLCSPRCCRARVAAAAAAEAAVVASLPWEQTAF